MIALATSSPGPHLFWITSRSAGIAAMVLASASVSAGLLIGRRSRRAGLGADVKALHESLSLATLAAVAVHGAALLGDQFLHPSLIEISMPFTTAYRTFWTGLGIAAGWALAALGLSYYARRHIGQSRWRSLHRFTVVFWLLALVHSLGAGSDAGQPWMLLLLGVSAAPALVLLAGKLARPAEEPSASRARDRGAARQARRPAALAVERFD